MAGLENVGLPARLQAVLNLNLQRGDRIKFRVERPIKEDDEPYFVARVVNIRRNGGLINSLIVQLTQVPDGEFPNILENAGIRKEVGSLPDLQMGITMGTIYDLQKIQMAGRRRKTRKMRKSKKCKKSRRHRK